MYNKLYIYFYDLYSPVASFFLCVCVCVCVCVHLWKESKLNFISTTDIGVSLGLGVIMVQECQ